MADARICLPEECVSYCAQTRDVVLGLEGGRVVQVIASFNRVRMLTPELGIIVEAVRGSSITELSSSGAALRCREGAKQWVLPPQERHAALQSPEITPRSPAAAAAAAAASAALAAASAAPSSAVAETFQLIAARTAAAVPEPAEPASAGHAPQPVSKQPAPADGPQEVAAGSGAVQSQEPKTTEATVSQQAPAPDTPAQPRILLPPLPAAAMRKGYDEGAQDDMFQLDEVLPVASAQDLLTYSRPIACKHSSPRQGHLYASIGTDVCRGGGVPSICNGSPSFLCHGLHKGMWSY